MRKYFNIIPAQDSCCILLYGDIGEWSDVSSGDIARELMKAEAQFKKIDVRINSNGGEVYAGIAIFNAFRNSKADITIYVDGIAASMASVIALCGKPVHMSKYARLMLHSVSGGVYGNKKAIQECLSEIEGLEDTLCDMYASRINKSKDEIKASYFDGKDHWIKAKEALALGLIDGIYDADPVPEESTPEEIYVAFNNRLTSEPQNQKDMKLEDVKKRKRFAACASDEDVLKEIDALETEAEKVPVLESENKTLKEANDAYKQEADTRETTEKKAILDAAEKDGRIDAKTRPTFEALLNADRKNGEAALDALPKKRSVIEDIAGGGGGGESVWEKRQKEIDNKNAKR